ncbi:outer membrane protein [Aestuariivirga sp.]|uniref:outer membrane protein n=1 Tax=Aestuariivirga sp. TaxID=2650926 RepID=UPI0039E468CB
MVRLGVGFLAALLVSSSAMAADVTMPVRDWTGPYVGIQAGYGWGKSDWSFLDGGTATKHDIDGFVGGAHLGYDFQHDSIVMGLVGDVNFGDVNGSSTCPNEDYTCKTSVDFLSTIRARIGVTPADGLLIYATGGLAIGDVHSKAPSASNTYKGSQTSLGWTIGGGAEYMITDNVSVGAQLLYVDLGNKKSDLKFDGSNDPFKDKLDMVVAQGTLSFRF